MAALAFLVRVQMGAAALLHRGRQLRHLRILVSEAAAVQAVRLAAMDHLLIPAAFMAAVGVVDSLDTA